jgi:hypothetical protein
MIGLPFHAAVRPGSAFRATTFFATDCKAAVGPQGVPRRAETCRGHCNARVYAGHGATCVARDHHLVPIRVSRLTCSRESIRIRVNRGAAAPHGYAPERRRAESNATGNATGRASVNV